MPAPTVIEVYDTNQLAVGASKQIVGTRRFKVLANQTLPALDAFTAYPGYDQLPGNPTARLIGYSLSVADSGAAVIVDAQYGTARSDTIQPPRDDPAYYFIGWGSRDLTVDIPVNIYKYRTFNTNGGTETFRAWVSEILKVPETRSRRVFRVRVNTGNVNVFDDAAAQKNNIHTIAGQRWQFVDIMVRERDGTFFDVEYTWEIDRGTPRPAVVGANNFVILNPSNRQADPTLLRLPYEALKPLPVEDPTNTPNETIGIMPYNEEPNGWQSLPGTGVLR